MTVVHGKCRLVMAAMPEASVDAVVCDPPYGLGFMGKAWDAAAGPGEHPGRRSAALDAVNAGNARQGGRQRACVDYQLRQARDARAFQAWCETWAREALRVLKPGGHLVAFGGTRTSHRLVCALEDAGFEIRDTLCWLYGQGFPKSLDVSKAIDKAAGAEREVVGSRGLHSWGTDARGGNAMKDDGGIRQAFERVNALTAPATPDAERWQGWGTALKPAHEPIVLARKPLAGTVAANVLAHGTGALNIDGCRIEGKAGSRGGGYPFMGSEQTFAQDGTTREMVKTPYDTPAAGRWPANVVLDEDAAAMLDEQTSRLRDPGNLGGTPRPGFGANGIYGRSGDTTMPASHGDRGGASRFFYCAKASSRERNAGLDDFETQRVNRFSPKGQGPLPQQTPAEGTIERNTHPTVKPIALMRWLCRLVTPAGGLVLDPFAGSGTTGIAATLEGLEFTGIEQDPDYVAIAVARIAHWTREHEAAAA